MKDKEKNIIYSKWLNNELSDDEKQALETQGDITILGKIIAEVDTWTLPEVRTSYLDFKPRLAGKTKNTPIIPLYRKLAIAASLALVATIGILVYKIKLQTTSHSTISGEIRTIQLPDGTKATLNSNSHLSYHNWDWANDRKVEMDGEVYFDIDKKGAFEVNFDGGQVHVLGTEFDILSSADYSKVTCYEGKVKTTINGKESVLTQGMGVDSENTSFTTDEKAPSWNTDYTKFKDAKLREVLKALSLRYDFVFDHSKIDINRKFTGQFINNNGKTALKMVFDPMGIRYEINDLNVTLQ